MSIHEFMSQNDGLAEDPEIELRKPTQVRKKRSHIEQHKRGTERTKGKKITDLTKPIGREDDFGDREYKLRLVDLTRERRNELITQMNFRLFEGKGKAYYMIGFSDDGFPVGISQEHMQESIQNLESMAEDILALAVVSQKRRLNEGKFVAEIMVTRKERNEVILDIRVILLGAEGSGKSTLIGTLTQGRRDNGRGLARGNICKNKHEMMTGKTTSVSQHVLGFNSKGDITNYSIGLINSFESIIDQSSKIVTLIDIAGSEKYAKSVISGMCSHLPDYAILVVDAVRGFHEITHGHLQLALALNLPLIVVITKVDKSSNLELNTTLDSISLPAGRLKLEIETKDDVIMVSNLFLSEGIVPVFKVSSVTLEGLDTLTSFLNLLPITKDWDHTSEKLFVIEQIIEKPDAKGKIVGGALLKGTVHVGQKMWLGPDQAGGFDHVTISNIHCKRVAVRSAKAGQFCSFLLSEDKPIRGGMVLLDLNSVPKAAMEFVCELRTVDRDKEVRTIKSNYQPLVHTQTVRQCAKLCDLDQEFEVSHGQSFTLRLKFLYRPEFLEKGTRLMIRDNFMTAVGVILEVEHLDGG